MEKSNAKGQKASSFLLKPLFKPSYVDSTICVAIDLVCNICDDKMKSLLQQIKEHRLFLGLKQNDMPLRIGVSNNTNV